jgi:hypothetical protein
VVGSADAVNDGMGAAGLTMGVGKGFPMAAAAAAAVVDCVLVDLNAAGGLILVGVVVVVVVVVVVADAAAEEIGFVSGGSSLIALVGRDDKVAEDFFVVDAISSMFRLVPDKDGTFVLEGIAEAAEEMFWLTVLTGLVAAAAETARGAFAPVGVRFGISGFACSLAGFTCISMVGESFSSAFSVAIMEFSSPCCLFAFLPLPLFPFPPPPPSWSIYFCFFLRYKYILTNYFVDTVLQCVYSTRTR